MKHGLLLINKPSGITSHDVVARVRRILKTREVGHAGTLDPLASGLMVLLIGEGTKISDYVLTGDKGYRVGVRFGIATDTFDLDGQVLREEAVDLAAHQIQAAGQKLTGDFDWPVPIFSAVRKDGQKLYEIARRGESVELPIKRMKFWDFSVIETSPNSLEAEIYCSKGSYIRTWVVELGKLLNVPSTVARLHRIYSAPYWVKQTITLEDLEKADLAAPNLAFIPLSEALPGLQAMTIQGKDERLMLSGQVSFDLERRLIFEQKAVNRSNQPKPVKILSGQSGQLLALLELNPGRKIKIKRVFKGLDAAL